MTARECDDQRLVGEDPVDEGGRQLIGEQADERDVELAGSHLLGHVPAPGVAYRNLYSRVTVVERGERALHDRGGPTDRGIAAALQAGQRSRWTERAPLVLATRPMRVFDSRQRRRKRLQLRN